jgi:hypothetical protein
VQLQRSSVSIPNFAARTFWEVFAGKGGLTTSFARGGWRCHRALDAFRNGHYAAEEDVLVPAVADEFRRLAESSWVYIHFGTPCSSFSRLRTCFGTGTRSNANPMGDGSREDELLGNRLLEFSCQQARALVKRGCWFSIEQPTSAYSWLCPEMLELAKLPGVRRVRFCQCVYGLSLPTSPAGLLVKKDTSVLTNVPLEPLECRCPGHLEHDVLKGSVRFDGHWVSKSALAGAYPPRLCCRWCEAANTALRNVCGGAEQEPAGNPN